jgi:hypothetical protein
VSGLEIVAARNSIIRPKMENERRENMPLPNKRAMIQMLIDDEPEPWIIMKPSRHDPTDPEPLCVFEHPAEDTQARAEIPLEWFQNRELERIRQAIQQSLRNAQLR